MAVTREYFYTLETYLIWDAIFNQQELDYAGGYEGDNPELIPNYLKVHAETTSTSKVSQWIIQKGYQIHYRLRFYKKVTGGTASQNGLYQLKDDHVKNISVNMNSEYSSKVKKGGIETRHNYNPRTSLEDVKNNDGDVFWFTVEPKDNGFTISKAFTVDADIVDPDNTTSLSATFKGFFPPFRVSAARPIPKRPDKFTDALSKEGTYSANKNLSTPQNYPYVYDHCKKQWVGINISASRYKSSTDKTMVQDYTIVTSDLKGAKITIGTKRTDPMIKSASGTWEEGKQIGYERKKLANLAIGNCKSSTSSPSSGDPSGDKDLPPLLPPNDLRWNPPTHRSSRSLPYGMLMDALVPEQAGSAEVVPLTKPEKYRRLEQFGKLDLHRGKIFQDPLGAKVLNTNPDGLALPEGKVWGFKFMYNPTTFSYSTSANNSVDWGLGSKDPSILLSGNQQVTLEVYINRIADMAYLTAYKAGQEVPALDKVYERTLENYEVDGLLARGTEFDIEFLYRVLNGDPLKKTLLFNPSYQGWTSDFGYTTAMPCWLHLNNNMRYYGSVASFQVNHAMFTVNMVPMLSTVTITFARYPALWGSNSDVFSEIDGKTQNDYKKWIAGTGQEPPKNS